MRSNFDGSAKQVIIPPAAAGDWIYVLAIHKVSGDLHFGLFSSHEIRVCNALGQNCVIIISNSSLVNEPVSIALDTARTGELSSKSYLFMYWTNRPSAGPHSLVRSNLNGTNAKEISTEFKDIRGITLDESSHGVLYWADYEARSIGNMDVNGGNKRLLVKLKGLSGPFGVKVDSDKIYIGNWDGNNIQSVDRDSGKQLTTILNSTVGFRSLALFYAPGKL